MKSFMLQRVVLVVFLSIFILSPVYPENSVLSTKSLGDIASRDWIEPFVQQVVFDSYQNYVREAVRTMITQRSARITSAMAEQVVMQSIAQGLEHPDVMSTVQDSYLLGVQESINQVKRKATQSVLQKNVESLVRRSMNRLGVYQGFQQIIEQQVQWAKNVQTHRDIQRSYQQQQVDFINQQNAVRQQVEAQQRQMQERLQKALKGKNP